MVVRPGQRPGEVAPAGAGEVGERSLIVQVSRVRTPPSRRGRVVGLRHGHAIGDGGCAYARVADCAGGGPTVPRASATAAAWA